MHSAKQSRGLFVPLFLVASFYRGVQRHISSLGAGLAPGQLRAAHGAVPAALEPGGDALAVEDVRTSLSRSDLVTPVLLGSALP